MVNRGKDPKTVPLTYVASVEGNSLYLNGYRIAGPKPWGGGRTLEEWEVTRDDIKTALSLTLSCTSPLSAWKNPAKKPVKKVRKRGA